MFFTNNKCFIITSKTVDLRYLGSLLSSKVLNFVFSFLGTPLQGKSFNLSKVFIQKLPIHLPTSEEEQLFIDKAKRIILLNKKLQKEVDGFKYWVKKEFGVKLSKKLEKYYNLTTDEFIDELSKKKVDTKSRKNREYLEREFTESLAIIKPLIQGIEKTDNEIDQMVYELYGLNDDEIMIIEKSLIGD